MLILVIHNPFLFASSFLAFVLMILIVVILMIVSQTEKTDFKPRKTTELEFDSYFFFFFSYFSICICICRNTKIAERRIRSAREEDLRCIKASFPGKDKSVFINTFGEKSFINGMQMGDGLVDRSQERIQSWLLLLLIIMTNAIEASGRTRSEEEFLFACVRGDNDLIPEFADALAG